MGQTPERLGENASNPHRWESADEIYFCLQSIHNHAPWIRTIWVIVDGDAPDLTGMAQAIRAKVRIVSHEEIFAGYAHVLPTFNSIAIESMMWRIDGLAERFLAGSGPCGTRRSGAVQPLHADQCSRFVWFGCR